MAPRSEDEGGGVPQRRLGPDGQVLPISKGLNLEELLMEAQYSHNEAGFRCAKASLLGATQCYLQWVIDACQYD